jgi:hypothetical protein
MRKVSALPRSVDTRSSASKARSHTCGRVPKQTAHTTCLAEIRRIPALGALPRAGRAARLQLVSPDTVRAIG